MPIKERIKDFEQCISLLKMIKDNTTDVIGWFACDVLIDKLTKLKEAFILSVTYSEVN